MEKTYNLNIFNKNLLENIVVYLQPEEFLRFIFLNKSLRNTEVFNFDFLKLFKFLLSIDNEKNKNCINLIYRNIYNYSLVEILFSKFEKIYNRQTLTKVINFYFYYKSLKYNLKKVFLTKVELECYLDVYAEFFENVKIKDLELGLLEEMKEINNPLEKILKNVKFFIYSYQYTKGDIFINDLISKNINLNFINIMTYFVKEEGLLSYFGNFNNYLKSIKECYELEGKNLYELLMQNKKSLMKIPKQMFIIEKNSQLDIIAEFNKIKYSIECDEANEKYNLDFFLKVFNNNEFSKKLILLEINNFNGKNIEELIYIINSSSNLNHIKFINTNLNQNEILENIKLIQLRKITIDQSQLNESISLNILLLKLSNCFPKLLKIDYIGHYNNLDKRYTIKTGNFQYEGPIISNEEIDLLIPFLINSSNIETDSLSFLNFMTQKKILHENCNINFELNTDEEEQLNLPYINNLILRKGNFQHILANVQFIKTISRGKFNEAVFKFILDKEIIIIDLTLEKKAIDIFISFSKKNILKCCKLESIRLNASKKDINNKIINDLIEILPDFKSLWHFSIVLQSENNEWRYNGGTLKLIQS